MKIPLSAMAMTVLIGLSSYGHAMSGPELRLDQVTVTVNADC